MSVFLDVMMRYCKPQLVTALRCGALNHSLVQTRCNLELVDISLVLEHIPLQPLCLETWDRHSLNTDNGYAC